MRLSRKSIISIAVVSLTAIGAILVHEANKIHDTSLSKSCANHFSFFSVALERLANENPDYILPTAVDTETAMEIITPDLKPHIRTFSQSCPEAYADSKKIGYIYTGEGLRIGDVFKNKWPILFCPSTSHRKSSEHAHAWPTQDGGYCIQSNAEMIKLIKFALKEAEAGKAPYSEKSIALMKTELQKRITSGS